MLVNLFEFSELSVHMSTSSIIKQMLHSSLAYSDLLIVHFRLNALRTKPLCVFLFSWIQLVLRAYRKMTGCKRII